MPVPWPPVHCVYNNGGHGRSTAVDARPVRGPFGQFVVVLIALEYQAIEPCPGPRVPTLVFVGLTINAPSTEPHAPQLAYQPRWHPSTPQLE